MTIAIFLASLLGAIVLGIPVAYALLLTGVALMLHLGLFDAQILAQNVINGADSFPLMAVPFFMLAGEVMNVGGLSKRIVGMCLSLVGHIKGGLGYVAIIASVILASLSGSAVADAAALTALLVPMIVAAGHDRNRAGGLVAAGGIIGPIIPPSIAFVIFGVAANLSITRLFLAGIMPGVYFGAALWITWWWVVRKEKIASPPKKSAREILRAVGDAFWALMLPVIIIVGLRFGVFTPTEAAVVAAVYSLFVALFVYRELKWTQLFEVFAGAAVTTSAIMFLIGASLVTGWMITVANLPDKVVTLLAPFMGNQTLLVAAMMLLVLAVGCVMDMSPSILILTPILMPIVKAASIDPIYFGVLFVVNTSIGLITPPVGVVLNTVASVAKISMDEVVQGVWPFLLAEVIILFLMVLFPALVTVPVRVLFGH